MTADYHQMPGLSSSGARKLLPPSCPAKFKWEQDNPPPPRDVFDFGTVAHTLVLGKGESVYVIDAPDWRSKEAREERDGARSQGLVPILRKDHNTAVAMANALRHQHPDLFVDGEAEVIKTWTDFETGTPLRTMFDWLSGNLIDDYKTAASADPGEFARSAFKYGYHIQAAWYEDTLVALGIDDPRFRFVVQEKTPPYLVSLIELDDLALTIGRHEYRKAIDIYARCVETDTWPGYSDDVVTVETPQWAQWRYMDEIAPDGIEV